MTHQCPESLITERSRWLVFLWRQCHNIVPGWSSATIQRVCFPHATVLADEYLIILQGFEIIRGVMLEIIAEHAEKDKPKPEPKPRGLMGRFFGPKQ